MAHFARIDDGTVQQVIVIDNEAIGGGVFPDSEPLGQAFISTLPDLAALPGEWRQASRSGSFRSVYPGQGWRYDAKADEFLPPAAPDAEAVPGE